MRGRAVACLLLALFLSSGPGARVGRAETTGTPAAPTQGEATAAAYPPRSVGIAYALAIGGVLAPMYVAKAIARPSGDIGLPAVTSMLAGISWGPSLGFAYGRAYRTALISGLLKSALVGTAFYIDHATLPPDKGHAYLSVLAASGVFLWSIGDIIRMGSVVREQNWQRQLPPPVVMPTVALVGDRPGLGVLGRF
jgi:hypothetical protein